jgi:hypothetical protein
MTYLSVQLKTSPTAMPKKLKDILCNHTAEKGKWKKSGKGKEEADAGTHNAYYCAVCHQEYKDGSDWIACDICDEWLDREYAGLLKEEAWEEYAGDGENDYVCPVCSK